MLATQTMLQLGVPLNRVLRRLRDVRQERYSLMRGYFPGVTDEDAPDHEAPRLRTIVATDGAACVGKTIESLNLAGIDVQLTAIRRTGERQVNPAPDARVRAGDVLVLLGTQESLAKAEMRLLQG